MRLSSAVFAATLLALLLPAAHASAFTIDSASGANSDGTPRFGEPWCRVGDFILFPRHEGALFGWKPKGATTAVPMISLADDKVQMVIESPTDVEPINVRDRI